MKYADTYSTLAYHVSSGILKFIMYTKGNDQVVLHILLLKNLTTDVPLKKYTNQSF